ncbi:MAG TPA: nucleoside triphosphate pyrophosphohydrolase [Anaerolineae bacterium]|nr:nucleoside triphosphate pyrophosphohydrolase [Anaerolineae bacterium]
MELLPDKYTCEHLVEIMSRLRGPQGCPWDKEQTHESLRRYLIEEAYETIEAIDENDPKHLKEELGDLLLQIVFHSQIASETGQFTMDDVSGGIITKLIRRHPHIFGEVEVSSAREVVINWEKIKDQEKGKASALSGIPKSLPALLYAFKLQAKAARVGFDWEDVDGALEKISEEVDELRRAKRGEGSIEDEIGDLLFAVVNVARHLDVDPELALKRTCDKFERRFSYMEEKSASENKHLVDMSLQEKDKLWDEAKKIEKTYRRSNERN